jgi:hypothetical protein
MVPAMLTYACVFASVVEAGAPPPGKKKYGAEVV